MEKIARKLERGSINRNTMHVQLSLSGPFHDEPLFRRVMMIIGHVQQYAKVCSRLLEVLGPAALQLDEDVVKLAVVLRALEILPPEAKSRRIIGIGLAN